MLWREKYRLWRVWGMRNLQKDFSDKKARKKRVDLVLLFMGMGWKEEKKESKEKHEWANFKY